MHRNPQSLWNSTASIVISPSYYEKQVVNWLGKAGSEAPAGPGVTPRADYCRGDPHAERPAFEARPDFYVLGVLVDENLHERKRSGWCRRTSSETRPARRAVGSSASRPARRRQA